jgi:hypothetical protein
MKIISGIFLLPRAIVAAYINKGIGIFIIIAGMVFLMPWKKNKSFLSM